MAQADILKVLSDTRLFTNVAATDLERIAAHWHQKKFAAQSVLMTAGTHGELMYLVVEGSLKIHLEAPDGGEIIIGLRGPGELLGELSLLEEQPRSATVTTLEPCVLLWTDRNEFATQARRSPQILENLICIVSGRLRIATAQILSLSGMDVRGRLACQLLALAQEFHRGAARDCPTLIPIRITQTSLGAMVGASRVSINGILGNWKRRKLVSFDSRQYLTILDRAGLEKEIG